MEYHSDATIQRAVKLMIEGYAPSEVADRMGVPHGTVESWQAKHKGAIAAGKAARKGKSGQIAGPCYARGYAWPSRYQRGW